MAILLEQIMPEGVTLEMLDQVTSDMEVDKNPPPGMIVHVHFMENSRARVVDVWESAEQHETFVHEKLMPAMQQRGVSMDAMPETSITEVARLVRGKS